MNGHRFKDLSWFQQKNTKKAAPIETLLHFNVVFFWQKSDSLHLNMTLLLHLKK